MASEIRVTNIKANDGTASLTVADSTGAVTTGQNLAVGGTLTSTGAITASGGIANAGTISAGTIGGGVSMASSGLTVRNITQVALASNQTISNTSAETTFFSPTYTPLFEGSKVQGILTYFGYVYNSNGKDSRKTLRFAYSGSGITNLTTHGDLNFGGYNYATSTQGIEFFYYMNVGGPLLTTSTTDVITATCTLRNQVSSLQSVCFVYGDGSLERTFMTWIEYK